MTPQEFKAWFEGYTENIKGVPTQKQWSRIQERVGQIDGAALSKEVIYRYWPWYSCSYLPYTYSTSTIPLSAGSISNNTVSNSAYAALTNIGRQESIND